jgi:hypothetical protein
MHGPTLQKGSTVGAAVAVGSPSWFGRLDVGRNEYSDYQYSAREADLSAGASLTTPGRSRITLCPEVAYRIELTNSLGPDSPVPTRASTLEVSMHAGVSPVLGKTHVMFFGGAGMFVSKSTIYAGAPPLSDTESSTGRGGFGVLGAGVFLGSRVTATTSLRVPFAVPYGFKSIIVVITYRLHLN